MCSWKNISWKIKKIFFSDSVYKVHFEVYSYTIETFSGQKKYFFLHTIIYIHNIDVSIFLGVLDWVGGDLELHWEQTKPANIHIKDVVGGNIALL